MAPKNIWVKGEHDHVAHLPFSEFVDTMQKGKEDGDAVSENSCWQHATPLITSRDFREAPQGNRKDQ